MLGTRIRLDSVFVIGFKYAAFALISIAVNLLMQHITFLVYSDNMSIYVAMLNGTIAGLICKYILDKNFIFYQRSTSITDDVRRFTIYSAIGGLLTLVFWVFEVAFDVLFDNELAKYVGAIIGLTIGYTAKFFLDRKYVFQR